MSSELIQVPFNYTEDIRTMPRGPSLDRYCTTRTTYASDAPQYRTSLELRPKLVATDFCTTLVVDTGLMEPTAYLEEMRIAPRTAEVRHGETVFTFAKEVSTVYKSTVVYDTREADYWYTSGVDFVPVGSAYCGSEKSDDASGSGSSLAGSEEGPFIDEGEGASDYSDEEDSSSTKM
ncbi:unnamed protein product [Ixodes hexagonus]